MSAQEPMPSPNASPSPDYLNNQKVELLKNANNSLIPKRSESTYHGWYSKFNDFVDANKLPLAEDSLLMYCEHLKQTEKPKHSSMYSYVSGIKSVLENTKGIQTKRWNRVKGWLKQYAKGKETDKAPIFTKDEMDKFRKSAPNSKYRRHKLAEGFGTYGRLRAQDYTNLFHNKCSLERKQEKIDIFKSYVCNVYICIYKFQKYCICYLLNT